jgi:hypothetical protein
MPKFLQHLARAIQVKLLDSGAAELLRRIRSVLADLAFGAADIRRRVRRRYPLGHAKAVRMPLDLEHSAPRIKDVSRHPLKDGEVESAAEELGRYPSAHDLKRVCDRTTLVVFKFSEHDPGVVYEKVTDALTF